KSIKKWQSMSLKNVIDTLEGGNDVNGKRHNHLRRLTPEALKKGHQHLQKNELTLKNSNSFKEIHNVTVSISKKIHGLGEMWAYDTAFAIGAHIQQLPKLIYLHRGTRTGARKILNKTNLGSSLKRSDLPPELWKLECYELEDFLCHYIKFV
ncbi:MAG: hypothetical protein RIB59_10825, partial [Rhodospirillales bacterium]